MEKVKFFSILIMSKVKMGQKRKSGKQIFLYVVLYMANYQNIDKKFKKCGGNFTYFCLGLKTEIGC